MITVWHWMTDRDDAFQELTRRYEEETGVKVNFELYAPSDAYSQKVRAAAQGKNLPDIFGILGEKRDFASFVKAGYILDLTPYMESSGGEWKNRFFAKALAVNEFSESNSYAVKTGIYGVPIDIMTIQMVYNKDLFVAFDSIYNYISTNEVAKIIEKIIELNIKKETINIAASSSITVKNIIKEAKKKNVLFNKSEGKITEKHKNINIEKLKKFFNIKTSKYYIKKYLSQI